MPSINISSKELCTHLFVIFLGSLTFQFIMHFSDLSIPFALLDDYHFVQADHAGFFRHAQIYHQIIFGRPISALILGFNSVFVSSIGELKILRIFSLVIFSISQAWLTIFLIRFGLIKIVAFSISGIIFATSGFASVAYWATASPFPSAVLFAMLSAELIYRAPINTLKEFKSNYKYIISAFISFYISLSIYPSFAVFIAVPFIGMLLFSNVHINVIRKNIVLLISIFGLGFLCYYILTKYAYFPLVKLIFNFNASDSIYSFSITNSILSRLDNFLTITTPYCANFITSHSNFVPTLVASTILLGSILYFIRKHSYFSGNNLIQTFLFKFASIAILLFLSAIHLIFAQDGGGTQARVIVAYQSSIILVFCWAIFQITQHFSKNNYISIVLAIHICIMGASFISTSYHLLTASINGWAELTYIKAKLRTLYKPEHEDIYIIKIPIGDPFIGTVKNGDFNWTTSHKISSMIAPMVAIAMNDIGIKDRYVINAGFDSWTKKKLRSIRVQSVEPNSTAIINQKNFNDKTSIVIDMRELLP